MDAVENKIKPYLQDQKRRSCLFCLEKNKTVNYKEVTTLKTFLSDRGKIVPRRISGTCAIHQRQITRAIKRSRNIALMAFSEPQ